MNEGTTFYSLSNPQSSFWYIEKLHPGTSIGNVAGTLKVDNDLDFEIVEKAINILLKRNEALRIRFVEQNGEAKQYVSEYKPYKLNFFDFRNEPVEKLYAWDAKQAQIPFSLIDSELFYFALVKFNDNSSGIFINYHHMISDAWSLISTGSEIWEYYNIIEKGLEIPIEDKPSYIEYVLNEQEYNNSERYQKDGLFWNEKYNDGFELTVLKIKKRKSESFKSNRKSFLIPDKLSAKIHQYCNDNKTSIFVLFFSALCLYINRVVFKENITIGVPVLNRSNAREKKTKGMFISTVPLTVKIDNNLDFETFEKKVYADWLSVLKHQKYPYDAILKSIREKYKGTEKLFDIAISYQNAKIIKDENSGKLEGRWHFNGYQTESLNIHISEREDNGNIVIDYDYLIDLFSKKEIEFIHDQITRLLWHALDNPKRKLPYIHIISENEKRKVINDFNDKQYYFPKNQTIHQIFDAQVEKFPNNIALVYEDIEMTYSELNKKANKVAAALRDKGVWPDFIVGIMMHRSPKMIIGILGILKAGGCYLPIDPDYPEDRIHYLLEDSNASLLLTEEDTKDIIEFNGEIINIDDEYISKKSDLNVDNINNPNNLAYVIYTSGSTGNPKGVMIEHRNFIPLFFNDGFKFHIDENDVWTLFHSFCFDFSVWEMFGALLRGGKIILVPKPITRNPKEFLNLLKLYHVTVLCQIPIALYSLINEEMECFDKSLDLKYVFFGGESLKPIMLKPFRDKYPDIKLINLYGITETTIADTYKEITDEDIVLNSNIIGKPLPTVKIYILDDKMNPVPIKVMGELCVGGEGVSRGYLNRPDLTTERFIESPFNEGERLYRSGDLARWYPDGDIEYLGRKDNQVKIRGFRIELGEIEKNILMYPGVKKATVIDKEDAFGKKYLCAYIVIKEDFDISLIKEHLMKKIPGYMVPSYFMKMESLPLTATGKVNTKALPEPEIDLNDNFVEPRNEVERILCKIWEEVLNVKRVGIDDNFFELGGDSLATVQLTSFLNKYNLEAKIQDIYEHPTIRALSLTVNEYKNISENFKDEIQNSENLSHNKHIKIESESISERILSGELPQLDSVAISYIPEDFILMHGKDNMRIFRKEFGDKPVLYHTISSELGHIGLIILPILSNLLYSEKKTLISQSMEALKLSESLGAKVASLTGLIPSATNYGEEIAKAGKKHCPNIQITTGHTSTAATIILSAERLLNESNRDIQGEILSVLGLGSIGTTVIKLLLSVMPHPSSITLCDIQEKSKSLIKLKNELINDYGYKNEINISLAKGLEINDDIYQSTMIIGATNVPNVLDVNKLKPGTLIIDDSGPHCFSKEKAIQRLHEKGDILFTEGGVLESPEQLFKTTYLPLKMNPAYLNKYKQHFLSGFEITGCILSGLLSAKFNGLLPIVGIADVKECYLHYQKLTHLNFRGAHLHCDDYVIPNHYIESFQKQYGYKVLVK